MLRGWKVTTGLVENKQNHLVADCIETGISPRHSACVRYDGTTFSFTFCVCYCREWQYWCWRLPVKIDRFMMHPLCCRWLASYVHCLMAAALLLLTSSLGLYVSAKSRLSVSSLLHFLQNGSLSVTCARVYEISMNFVWFLWLVYALDAHGLSVSFAVTHESKKHPRFWAFALWINSVSNSVHFQPVTSVTVICVIKSTE